MVQEVLAVATIAGFTTAMVATVFWALQYREIPNMRRDLADRESEVKSLKEFSESINEELNLLREKYRVLESDYVRRVPDSDLAGLFKRVRKNEDGDEDTTGPVPKWVDGG